MEFYIGDKKYKYTEDELYLYLLSDNGIEGNVYAIDNQAVKIYRPSCRKARLEEADVDFLKTQKTKRLLLPEEKVYNAKRRFNGYTTKLIDSKTLFAMREMKITKLLEEMSYFKEDSVNLAEEKVLIDDLYLENIVVGDGLYSCDPGSFSREERMSERQVEIENRYMVNSLFIDEIFKVCYCIPKKEREILKDLTNSGEYISDILSWESIDPDESVSHLVKRITNR